MQISSDTASFRAQILDRDRHRCVVCAKSASHVHLIFDARLWDSDPNLPNNAVTLCDAHRDAALCTQMDVEALLAHAGIAVRPLPPQLHAVERYDRWGNVLLADGRRARGELFFEPEARCWLDRAGLLQSFTPFVKYPRTFVLPWSGMVGAGDRVIDSLAPLQAGPVIVTEKMDGENVTLYRDFLHTRTVSRIPHASRAWLDAFWDSIHQRIPVDWRICGEYLFVTHTVAYRALPSYFMAFSVWDERNVCLDWDHSVAFLRELEIACVPVLYRGPLDRAAIDQAWRDLGAPNSEGYILRSAGAFALGDFRRLVGKYIRADYQQSEPVKDNIRTGAAFATNLLE